MKFPLGVLRTQKNREKLLELQKHELCDNCLGRMFGMVGHGFTNAERGEILRKFANELAGSESKESENCELCNNFFKNKIDETAEKIIEKFRAVQFRTFLIGSALTHEIGKKQDELWQEVGVDDVESIKSEINRELGKKIEKLAEKKFEMKNPDVTVFVDLGTGNVKLHIRSLFVFGEYQKLVRNIPQTKWICSECGGKGCKVCKGTGKRYKTSVQEEIEKPFIKLAKARESSFHGAGREDIDARCLAFRPFVIEILKPKVRKIDLKKVMRLMKSKKVKIKSLKFVDKDFVRKIKAARIDKTYVAVVDFEKDIDKKKLKGLRTLKTKIIQRTPIRVAHRRADLQRKRLVKGISWKVLGKRKLELKVRSEAGLYIKELITGDEGRTSPNASEILGNKVKSILLDVVKIHSKF